MPTDLVTRIRTLRGHVVERRGERLVMLPQRAIWWPAQSVLIVADLHFGKAECYRALGVPMPGGMLEETLTRLDALLASTEAQALIVLGDLVHSRAGLTTEITDAVAGWIDATPARITLVEGNHDRLGGAVSTKRATPARSVIPQSWTVEIVGASFEMGPIRLVHEPSVKRGCYTLAGHLHPTVHMRGRGDALRLPCFHLRPRVGVLPAFTPFSRGVPVIADDADIVLAIADGELFPMGSVGAAPLVGFDGMDTDDGGADATSADAD